MKALSVYLFAFAIFATGCVSTTTPGTGLDAVVSDTLVTERIPFSWENTTEAHPERKPWSDKWVELLKRDQLIYETASDLTRVCPKYKSLTKTQKLKALGEFWVAIAYYESGFNPKSQSVDVGTADNKDSWSVGLYQLSVRDAANKKGPNYSFSELNTAIPNIDLANTIMTTQIKNCGKMILPNSSKCRYWAVLLDGNKYSKVEAILSRVKKQAPFCY